MTNYIIDRAEPFSAAAIVNGFSETGCYLLKYVNETGLEAGLSQCIGAYPTEADAERSIIKTKAGYPAQRYHDERTDGPAYDSHNDCGDD